MLPQRSSVVSHERPGGAAGSRQAWCALPLPSKDSVELPGAVTLPQGHRGRNRRDAARKATSLPTQIPVTLKGEKKALSKTVLRIASREHPTEVSRPHATHQRPWPAPTAVR